MNTVIAIVLLAVALGVAAGIGWQVGVRAARSIRQARSTIDRIFDEELDSRDERGER